MATRTDWAEAARFLSALPVGEAGLLCAVSGGLDSMCLLHFVRDWGARRGVAVAAAHFNHTLRGEAADRDEAFVRDRCAAQGIPAVFGRGDTRRCAEEEGRSPEEAARTLRYAFLEQTARRDGYGCVLTAHHADDNAETMLLNLIRGTGAQGLAGIPRRRGLFARPFLELTRADLAQYAAAHDIPHVEDETNALDGAARNVLRHQVLPVLEALNPRAVPHMSRTAALLRQDGAALERMTEQTLAAAQVRPGVSALLPLRVWADCPEAVRRRALLALPALVSGSRKDLTAAHVAALEALCRGRVGQADLPDGLTARRTAEGLLIARRDAPPEERSIRLGETVRWGGWAVRLEAAPDPNFAFPEGAALTLTPWRGADRMTLPGGTGSRSLKRLCVDRGISPAQRDALPILRVDGRAAAVPGVGTDAAFLPGAQQCAARLTFMKQQTTGGPNG